MKVLVIDDDKSFCEAIGVYFEAAGHEVSAAYDLSQGLLQSEMLAPDCTLLDWNLPDGCGRDVIPSLRRSGTGSIIMLSAVNDVHNVVTALKAGADNFLYKPVNLEELRSVVAEAGLHPLPRPSQTPPAAFSGPVTQRQMKLKLFQDALARNGGNKSKAAKELGVTRQTLSTWLKSSEPSEQDS
jgi:DNA-binding NtrC family response regulator